MSCLCSRTANFHDVKGQLCGPQESEMEASEPKLHTGGGGGSGGRGRTPAQAHGRPGVARYLQITWFLNRDLASGWFFHRWVSYRPFRFWKGPGFSYSTQPPPLWGQRRTKHVGIRLSCILIHSQNRFTCECRRNK